MIRLILVLLIAILYLVIGCIPAFILWLIGKKNPDLKDRISRRMIQWIFGVLLFVSGTKVKAEGLENIPKDRAVLYVGNHRSYFDIITSYRLLPGITGYVAKKEMAKVPLLRLWMRYIHCLFLDRSNVKEGLKTILAGVDELKNGHSIWIFPEGTRNRGEEGSMLEFKEGSLKIAEKGGCPVVPVAITGTADIFEKHLPFIRPSHVTIEFGRPFLIKELAPEHKKFPGAYVGEQIKALLREELVSQGKIPLEETYIQTDKAKEYKNL